MPYKDNPIKEDGMVRHGEMRVAYRILVRKPERKRALGKRMSRWENNT
jgi:hypothetical protein